MKCPKCFNEIPNDSKMCPICQNIFAAYFEEIKLTPKQKIRLFLHRILFPTILIILIITTITVQYIKYKTKMDRITDVNELVINKETYINDLYISDERHYKYLLNNKEQELYTKLIDAIKNNQEYIDINISDYSKRRAEFNTDVFKRIKQAISMDHPELINLGYIKQSDKEEEQRIYIYYSKVDYNNSITELKNVIEQIKSETENYDEYEKIKYIYEYIKEKTPQPIREEPKIYGAACILDGQCNSEGYAKIAQIIFQNLKINSILVTGNINAKYHEWNIVKVKNKYYYYDQTTNKILFKDKTYELYNKKLLPKINGKEYAK